MEDKPNNSLSQISDTQSQEKDTDVTTNDATTEENLEDIGSSSPAKGGASTEFNLSESVEWAKFNVLPIFIFLFFIAMAIFFTIPQIRSVFDGLDQINALQAEYDSKESTLERLSILEQEQSADAQLLQVVDEVVPSESTRVVNYKSQLVDIGIESGLLVTNSSAGESFRFDDDGTGQDLFELDNDKLHIVVIPIDFEASGPIANFEEFLVNLYTSYDFFVVEEMDISRGSLEQGIDEWSATFRIVKYQFSGEVDITQFEIDSFIELANQTPNQEVVGFIQERFNRRIQELGG